MTAHSADGNLVLRCLAHEQSAWADLFALGQPLLLRRIAGWLGPAQRRGDLAEEVAARVWLKLVEADGKRLSRFNPARGSKLTAFLVGLARHEFLMVLRGERRQARRERIWASGSPEATFDSHLDLELADYLDRASVAERATVARCLGRPEGHGVAAPLSYPDGAIKKRKSFLELPELSGTRKLREYRE
jgi:DNA-directed RNA polymerase specialized sigma24 family protein